MLNEGKAAAPEAGGTQGLPAESAYLERRVSSSVPFVWKWVLRLGLPLLVALSVKALDWLWVDNIYGTRWLDIVGGTLLALGVASIALWCACEWMNDPDDPRGP
jgi:hypothetical protein